MTDKYELSFPASTFLTAAISLTCRPYTSVSYKALKIRKTRTLVPASRRTSGTYAASATDIEPEIKLYPSVSHVTGCAESHTHQEQEVDQVGMRMLERRNQLPCSSDDGRGLGCEVSLQLLALRAERRVWRRIGRAALGRFGLDVLHTIGDDLYERVESRHGWSVLLTSSKSRLLY